MTISPAQQVQTLQAPALALFASPSPSAGVMSAEDESSVLASAYGVDPAQLTSFGDQASPSADQVLTDWVSEQSGTLAAGTLAPAPSDTTSVLTAYYTMLDSSSDPSLWNNLVQALTASGTSPDDASSAGFSTTA